MFLGGVVASLVLIASFARAGDDTSIKVLSNSPNSCPSGDKIIDALEGQPVSGATVWVADNNADQLELSSMKRVLAKNQGFYYNIKIAQSGDSASCHYKYCMSNEKLEVNGQKCVPTHSLTNGFTTFVLKKGESKK